MVVVAEMPWYFDSQQRVRCFRLDDDRLVAHFQLCCKHRMPHHIQILALSDAAVVDVGVASAVAVAVAVDCAY